MPFVDFENDELRRIAREQWPVGLNRLRPPQRDAVDAAPKLQRPDVFAMILSVRRLRLGLCGVR